MKRPTRPKARTPPRTPKTTIRNGIRVAFEITSGRTMLSTQLTAVRPHSSRPVPCQTLPVTSSQMDRLSQINGAPNGTSATTAVAAPSRIGALTPNNA